MTDEKKKQLFPYFAYLYSQELNPEKYGAANSIEEWTDLIQNSPEDINEISAAASELTDEDWDQIEQQYAQAQTEGSETATAEEIQSAKKGAKLKKLQEFKTGGKSKKKKKCACGCEMISKKEKGGQLVDVCSCCGKTHKFQRGGSLYSRNYFKLPGINSQVSPGGFVDITQPILGGTKPEVVVYGKGIKPQPIATTPTIPSTTTMTSKNKVTTSVVPRKSDRLTSIVDYLNAEGMNSSFGNRRQLAAKLGIQNYIGSSDQNKRMIELLQAQRQQDLAQAKIATPSLAPAPVTATLPPITPTLTTMLASRKKGGNIKKVQKGGEATNPALKGMKPAQVDSVQAYNRSAPVTNFDKKAKFDPTSDQRNAKKILNDLRTGKSKLDPEESKRLKAKLAKTKK